MTDNRARRPVQGTRTSDFGVSRRENHDSAPFYARFTPPSISGDDSINPAVVVDRLWHGDARRMDDFGVVADNSVALVVTSPPYFAGKEYEQALGEGHIPATYFEYLDMLEAVFAECVRKLEPGGRMAVNVANLGRKPYRSLSSDVIGIFEQLGLLLRGEVIWRKAKGAGGSCAWGTFQRPGNPVLRDVTERVLIASKGRFDRSLKPVQRHSRHLPSEGSMLTEDFLEATTDVWEILPERASRVNHPAPFPVELPQRLIDLYTYRGDLVLDPFIGSGTTAVAAVRTERHYVGFDTDEAYLAIAETRVDEERNRLTRLVERGAAAPRVIIPAIPWDEDAEDLRFEARAVRQGKKARDLARLVLEACGFEEIAADVKYPKLGVEVNFEARDQPGGAWRFDVSGAFTTNQPGLRRTDILWKALGKAAVLAQGERDRPLVLLTTHLPVPGSAGAKALAAATGPDRPIYDVIEILSPDHIERLGAYARQGPPTN